MQVSILESSPPFTVAAASSSSAPMAVSVSPLLLLFISLSLAFSLSYQTPDAVLLRKTLKQCLQDQSRRPISAAIFSPADPSFSSVLQAYIRNLRFNSSSTPKPMLIVAASDDSHAQAAVECSRRSGIPMRIRSGGHDYEGTSYVSAAGPFFILDMFGLRTVHVDVAADTAWVGAGATLGEVYYRISEASRTRGFPAGVCPTVGVGGHLSGGGYGNMMRKYGLSADHILDARLVDAGGRILERESMGEDLFWAIRGGGAASFGVLLAYKIRLVAVPETVTVFRIRRTLEQNATGAVLRWQQVADKLDEDLFIRLSVAVANATGSGGRRKTITATFIGFFLGGSGRLLALTDESFPELGLRNSDCVEMSWAESVLFWAEFPAETQVEALLDRRPLTLNFLKRKSDYVKKPIPEAGLRRIWAKMMGLEASPMMTFNPYGGEMSRIPPSAIPFPHRAGNLCKIQYAANWEDPGGGAEERELRSTRELYSFMAEFVSGEPREAFLNYKDLDLGINRHGKGSYWEGRAYGVKYFLAENYERLVAIKAKVDPLNLFRSEQSIPNPPHLHDDQ